MNNGMLGADPEQLRDLAMTMSLSGEDLSGTATNLQEVVSRLRWVGHDADSFRNRWSSYMRPTLRAAGDELDRVSRMLIAQAEEQERASSDTGGGGAPAGPGGGGPQISNPDDGGGGDGSGGPGTDSGGGPQISNPGDSPTGESLDNAFTDPEYVPAPGGIEWLMDDVLGFGGGSEAQNAVNQSKFVADGFSFADEYSTAAGAADDVLGMGSDVAGQASKFSNVMDMGGNALSVVGVGLGVADMASGIAYGDGFRVADGAISTALSAAAIAATATGVGAPVGIAIGAVGLLWGAASMISGDIPVTKRIADGIGWLGGLVGIK